MIAERKEKNVYLELIKSKDCTFSLKIGNRWYINKRLLDKWLSKKTLKK